MTRRAPTGRMRKGRLTTTRSLRTGTGVRFTRTTAENVGDGVNCRPVGGRVDGRFGSSAFNPAAPTAAHRTDPHTAVNIDKIGDSLLCIRAPPPASDAGPIALLFRSFKLSSVKRWRVQAQDRPSQRDLTMRGSIRSHIFVERPEKSCSPCLGLVSIKLDVRSTCEWMYVLSARRWHGCQNCCVLSRLLVAQLRLCSNSH